MSGRESSHRFRKRVRPVTYMFALGAAWVVAGCSSAGQASTEVHRAPRGAERPAMIAQRGGGPTRWAVAGRPHKDRLLHIFSIVEYCGGPKPRYGSVRISEKRLAVIVTAHVVPKDEGSAACAPLEITLEKTIRLHRRLGGRMLLDGSASPPARRWPRKRS